MPTVHLTVRGKVQGVGFRWFVRETARRANLAGWVRNLANGDVELQASGSNEALQRLLDAVRRGPPKSRVDLVERHPVSDDGPLPAPFTVLR